MLLFALPSCPPPPRPQTHLQARADLNATIKRVKESESRIDSAIKPSVDKAYWWVADAKAEGGGHGGALIAETKATS